jgi:uncharacterized protein (TIGR03067 family)
MMIHALLLFTVLPAGELGQDKPDPSAKERARLQGAWTVVSHEANGKKSKAATIAGWKLTVSGDRMTTRDGTELLDESTFRLRPAATPRGIDLKLTAGPDKGKQVKGIYKLDGDSLTICVAEPGKERPKAFKTSEGSGHMLFVFKRAKP